MRRDISFIFGYVVSIDMNFIYKKRSMLNFKESVAKVKSAPNFGKITTIGIQTSVTKNVIFFFAFLESTLGGKSTLGVCAIAQTIEICSKPLRSGLFCNKRERQNNSIHNDLCLIVSKTNGFSLFAR